MTRSTLLAAVLATAAWADRPGAIFCPLEIEPHPKLNPSLEALRKRFYSAARDASGLDLAARLEAESIVAGSGLRDFERSDASLVRVADLAKVPYAGYAKLALTAGGQLVLTARVVSDQGKVVALAQVELPRGKKPLPEVLGELTERLFLQLRTTELPLRPALAAVEPPPVPPLVDAPRTTPAPVVIDVAPFPTEAPVPAVEASAPPRPLRTVGFVVAGVGAATAAGGALLYGLAGTVEQRPDGSISIHDAGRVDDIRTKQGLGLGLLIGGAAITAAGLVTAFALGGPAPVTASAVPLEGGGLVTVGGAL